MCKEKEYLVVVNNSVEATYNNLDEAIDMFAKIKRLTRSQFLNIFIVEQSK